MEWFMKMLTIFQLNFDNLRNNQQFKATRYSDQRTENCSNILPTAQMRNVFPIEAFV